MMSGNSLEDVKKIIKSLALAHQNGLGPIALNNEFQEMEGRSIPFKSFGSNSLIEFLKNLSDILTPGCNKAGEQVFFARADASTAHIANFVANQRSQPVKRRNNMVRNDDKRPCRVPAPLYVPPPLAVSNFQSQPSPERSRTRKSGSNSTNGNTERRREPERTDKSERTERRRVPSPMSISPTPRHSPTPEPDRFRNPSPPRRVRSHSFRDPSPDRTWNRPTRDVSPLPQSISSADYETALQKAREKRGLPPQRSRRSHSRSPSPRRSRYRPSPPYSPPRRRSPPRIQTKTVSCQTEPNKVVVKKCVSVSCQTDSLTLPEKTTNAQTFNKPTQPDHGDDQEQDLNAAYYGPNSFGINYNNNPYNNQSSVPVPDPSYEEDKSQKGSYYDFDAGTHKQIPFVPEWYAHWIWNGWVPPTTQSYQQNQNPYQPQYPPHLTQYQPQMQQTSISVNNFVNSAPIEPPPPQPMKVIPTTPTTNSATRDPRLARQTAALANAKVNDKPTTVGSTVGPTASAKRKALSLNDYMKTRKLGPEKSQHIAREETSDFPERPNSSPRR